MEEWTIPDSSELAAIPGDGSDPANWPVSCDDFTVAIRDDLVRPNGDAIPTSVVIAFTNGITVLVRKGIVAPNRVVVQTYGIETHSSNVKPAKDGLLSVGLGDARYQIDIAPLTSSA